MLERPFMVPMYPFFPVIALVIAIVSLTALAIYNGKLALIYILLIGACYGCFRLFTRKQSE
jgi:ethanolamine permease